MMNWIMSIRSTRACIATFAVWTLATTAAVAEPGSRQTRDFVQAAAQSDQFEIMEGRTALAQSTNPHVRAFAEAMIEAHERTGEQLRKAAIGAGLNPPKPGLGGDQSMFLAALQSQRGADFDKAYIRQQVLAHAAALAIERDYAASGDNETIRQAASLTVPIISAHEQMAERTSATVGGE
jgi:putative membrane protein